MTGGETSLIFLITHPREEPNSITSRLSLQPSLVQRVGEQVVTPAGKAVEGSFYKVNRWQYKEALGQEGDWTDDLERLVRHLRNHTSYFKNLVEHGGSCTLYFSATISGHTTVQVSPELLKIMSDAGLSFGYEFF